jgi:hypothetical protein
MLAEHHVAQTPIGDPDDSDWDDEDSDHDDEEDDEEEEPLQVATSPAKVVDGVRCHRHFCDASLPIIRTP